MSIAIRPDISRVIARLFQPGDIDRVRTIIARIMAISDDLVDSELARVRTSFGPRHRNFDQVIARHASNIGSAVPIDSDISPARRALLGAYFTCEYSIESVAMFNPSMVPHPDQSGLESGECRYVMSLRACGEGHLSSIEFRTGVVTGDGDVRLDPVTPYVFTVPTVDDKRYHKDQFFLKLIEMGAFTDMVETILERVDDQFTLRQLEETLEAMRGEVDGMFEQTADAMRWLAHSNYFLHFPPDSPLSERVIFPVSQTESRGIEDARFVHFRRADGSMIYYATYSAYDGIKALPQFIETTDFAHFKVSTLSGKYAQNKGLAIFPRMVKERYLAIGRPDGETLHLTYSDNLRFWNYATPIQGPREAWEAIQIGNCGSPIETPDGWLLLTHGVGAMREYHLGAMLLDLDDPTRVIGALREPLLSPAKDARDGYVPNVVYSCGAMVHGDHLVIPYAVCDSWSTTMVVSLSELITRLKN